MRAGEIRRTFLEFFREREHRVFPSSSLVPDHPMAPLLTNAGMNQFIPYFLGEKPAEFPRAASCQKCARTPDIDIIGTTARHMSLFEMLGNFSFGDYYKKEAIQWAWELSTGPLALEPDRIWVTVFEEDDEAAEIWHSKIGIPWERITRRGAVDNFWWMEVAGPGGPCSELFYDRGRAHGELESFDDGERTERIMEFWNLVFTEKEVDGRGAVIRDLPRKNVDTGLGLDRLAAILQGVQGVWETEHIRPILARAEALTGRTYGKDATTDVRLRRLADHARSSAFLIADGVLPSNEDRGYVVRRLVRRGVNQAKLFGVDDPVMIPLVASVVDVLGDAYPELVQNRAFVEQVIGAEEEGFRGTLGRGLTLLSSATEAAKRAEHPTLAGDVSFKLHDTYGFPFELTLEIAQEAGVDVDRESFERLMSEQRERARAARKEADSRDGDAVRAVLAEQGPSVFVGYDRIVEETKLVALIRGGERVLSVREGDDVEVVLDATPFYPEGGGQVGDSGVITADGARLEVVDTQRRLGDVIVHVARVAGGEVSAGTAVRAAVDADRRAATQRSHTATHILHATLRAALGEHARQAGSQVEPGRLRFDFPHFDRVPQEVLDRVEEEVNAHLIADDPVRPYETTMEEARSRGALMLFEEKYGDVVRVVEIGDYSIELCGGIHVARTSQVGAVKVLGEASIGSNLRRVEALTGAAAIAEFRRSRAVIEHIATLLRTSPEDAPARVERLLADLKAAEAQIRKAQSAGERSRATALTQAAERMGEVAVVVAEVPGLAVEELQRLAFAVRDALGGAAVVVLASAAEGRAGIVAVVDKGSTGRGVSPRALIAGAAGAIGGGAGGKGELATGGGSRPDGIAEALRLARAAVSEVLG